MTAEQEWEALDERLDELLDEVEPDVGIARSVLLDRAAQLTIDYWDGDHMSAVKDLIEWIDIRQREAEKEMSGGRVQ